MKLPGQRHLCFNESESFSEHIVSFIFVHIQFLIRPVRQKNSKDMVFAISSEIKVDKEN